MREILFRGKRISNGKWVKGFYLKSPEFDNQETAVITSDKPRVPHYISKETVGQYTGLTDNNGKKIFEGDIVKFGKYTFQIIFSVGSFALYDEQGLMIAKIGGVNDHCYSLMDLYVKCCWEELWAYDIEVIGNIHDNPELLKGE